MTEITNAQSIAQIAAFDTEIASIKKALETVALQIEYSVDLLVIAAGINRNLTELTSVSTSMLSTIESTRNSMRTSMRECNPDIMIKTTRGSTESFDDYKQRLQTIVDAALAKYTTVKNDTIKILADTKAAREALVKTDITSTARATMDLNLSGLNKYRNHVDALITRSGTAPFTGKWMTKAETVTLLNTKKGIVQSAIEQINTAKSAIDNPTRSLTYEVLNQQTAIATSAYDNGYAAAMEAHGTLLNLFQGSFSSYYPALPG